MRVSARNVWKGTVTKIVDGMVNCEVTVTISGGHEVVAIVTKAAVNNLGLAVGKEAYAIVKATNVMVGVD